MCKHLPLSLHLAPQVESLRKDVEIISQSHERDVDRKEAMLQMLDRDLDEAEEQYQIALRQHLRNVDTLIELQVGGDGCVIRACGGADGLAWVCARCVVCFHVSASDRTSACLPLKRSLTTT